MATKRTARVSQKTLTRMRDNLVNAGAEKTEHPIQTLTLAELFAVLREIEVNGHNDWSAHRAPDSWSGNMTFSKATDSAEFGWQDAPEIPALTLPVIPASIEDVILMPDVTGDFFNLDGYLTDAPEQWYSPEIVEVSGSKILKLAIEVGGLGDVTETALENRGAAIVAMVNSLELAGYSIELVIVRAFHDSLGSTYKFLIPVKLAGEALDIRRIQFMVGNPAFYRKCLFGLTERAMGASMNTNLSFTDSYAPDGYIHIEHSAGRSEWREASMEWAARFADCITACLTQN